MITYKNYIYRGIKPSSRTNKKKMAVFEDKKTGRQRKIHFGQRGASDFTKHKDVERKNRYLARHKVNEDWNDLMSAGALSRYVLWNKPTLKDSISDYEKRLQSSE